MTKQEILENLKLNLEGCKNSDFIIEVSIEHIKERFTSKIKYVLSEKEIEEINAEKSLINKNEIQKALEELQKFKDSQLEKENSPKQYFCPHYCPYFIPNNPLQVDWYSPVWNKTVCQSSIISVNHQTGSTSSCL